MRLFQVTEKTSAQKQTYIDGVHKWKLPGVYCEVCGETWAVTGISYPSLTLPPELEKAIELESRVIPWQAFQSIQQRIVDNFPFLKIIPPGTNIGPLLAGIHGPDITGFIPFSPWDLVIESSSFHLLRDQLKYLPLAVPVLLEKTKRDLEIFEFEIRPFGTLMNANALENEFCIFCNRRSTRLPERLVVDGSTIPDGIDVFRLADFPTVILASERFVNTVKEIGLAGIESRPVEVG